MRSRTAQLLITSVGFVVPVAARTRVWFVVPAAAPALLRSRHSDSCPSKAGTHQVIPAAAVEERSSDGFPPPRERRVVPSGVTERHYVAPTVLDVTGAGRLDDRTIDVVTDPNFASRSITDSK